MGRNLAATISKAVALPVIFTGAAALVAMQQAPAYRPPAPPPMQPPPPQARPPQRPPDLRQPRFDRGTGRSERFARRDGEAHQPGEPGMRAGRRTDTVERRPSERQVRQMSTHVRDTPAQPHATRRLMVPPTPAYWYWRYNSIYRWLSTQKGFIPVTAVPSSVSQVTDHATKKTAGKYAGWKGYGLVVPPGESVTFNLYHPNMPWFRLIICDKWGGTVPGGLSSLMPQPVPRLKYTNPGFETETIYLIVDDPGWMSHEQSPYTLEMDRSWNPDLFPEDLGSIVNGIWGNELVVSAEFSRPMPGRPWVIML